MPEQFKLYTPEEAWDEAELIKQKMSKNEKLSYAVADRLIDGDKAIENAKNGILARKIRSLDLAKEENVEEFRKIMEPLRSGKHKILDENGQELFQAKTFIRNFENKVECFLDAFKCVKELKNFELSEKLDHYGHELYKSTYQILEMSTTDQNVKEGLFSKDGSDAFYNTIGAIAHVSATAMNGSLAQRMISYQYRLSKNNELTKTFVENHPNNKSIMEMTEKVDDFFITLREVLLKFLSNLIQDPKFVFSGKNTKITPEQIISDFEQAQKIYNSNDYSEEGWMKIKREACTAELSEETEAQTRMFIQKVEQYQKVLDEFNKKLKYAKLQAENKE